MEKKVIKKLLALLMIVMILSTDFFVLGSNLVTYAAQLNSETNNSNVEFSAYFKSGEERMDSIEKSIKAEDLKLYAEIKVKNEGYFNGAIEIQNSNFNIKEEVLSSAIASIDGNKVNLKQVNAGETVEIELGIEPIISDKMAADMLSKTSTVKLTGKYIYSKAESGTDIKAEKLVSVDYKVDETAKAELETDIITNKVFSVNGANKRIVQLLIKSRLLENQYPVQQTKLNVQVPELSEQAPEEINVLAIGQLATNGATEISAENCVSESGTLQITLNNDADANNEISWIKNAYDELVVTFIYAEDVDASKIEIKSDSEIKLHNSGNTYTATFTKGIQNQEPNKIIMERTEITTSEIYKGQLYANINATEKKDVLYNTETNLIITNANVVDEVVVNAGPDVFGIDENEFTANTKYVSTEIDRDAMLKILGQDGNITIKNGDTTTLINKDSEVNENGNIVINYENSSTELSITTSKPINSGVLGIKHVKAITENSYTREQLKTIEILKAKNSVEGTRTVNKEKQNIVTNSTEASVELKETISKAELTVSKENLSTIESNEVTLGVELITDGVQYDLYKNPSIKLQLPAAVENVELITQPSKLNADEFNISSKYDNVNKIIQIDLTGEQTKYAESSATQAYLQLKLNVTLSKTATTKTDKITMTYTNKNASQYDGGTTDVGIVEKQIGISAPSGLIKMFNLDSNENESLSETITQQITSEDAGKTLNFETVLVNNIGTDIKNVRILGKLPTTENIVIEEKGENTLKTVLTSIVAPNATVYYTENVDATADVENASNGWTTDLAELENAKLYLIKLNSLSNTSNYTANISINIPSVPMQSVKSYTEYEVIYDTDVQTDIQENARKIGLEASIAQGLELELTAQVGQDVLNNGDTVREGEVIRYTATLKNDGTKTLENLGLKLNVPEGTVYVKPIEEYTLVGQLEDDEDSQDVEKEEIKIEVGGYVYAEGEYYEEITDSEELAELTEITIPQLTTTETYTIVYEVRVKTDITAGTEISNKVTVTYNNSTMESEEIVSSVAESNVRVTIKRIDDVSITLIPGLKAEYEVYVENLSDEKISDLDLEIKADNLNVIKLTCVEDESISAEAEGLTGIHISEIPAKEKKTINLLGRISENAKSLVVSTNVIDSNKTIYRSNIVTETFENVDAEITLTSPQNNAYVKNGDEIEYNITIKNTGESAGFFTIDDDIPEYLEVEELYMNGTIIKQTTNQTETETYTDSIPNWIMESIDLNPGKEAQLKVIAKVNYVLDEDDSITKEIINKATVNYFEVEKDESEEVKHILISDDLSAEKVKNIISGTVWIDKDGNGENDDEESIIDNVTVRLYDNSTKKYVTTEEGYIIQVKTNSTGKYEFSGIKNGEYMIVFEYDKEKYEPTTNSRAKLQEISVNGENITVVATEVIDIQDNTTNINIALKEKTGNSSDGNQEELDGTESISGLAWLDTNRDGEKNASETVLQGIKVKLYSVSNKNYLTDNNGNIVEATTGEDGQYKFNNIEKGSYIVLFEYDKEKYEPTIYFASGVDTTKNSKAILKNIAINGEELTLAVTDTINLQADVSNINLGLKEKLTFDLELNKYISKIVVQNSKGTKTYDYEDTSFGKVEIHRKQINGSLVVLEYTIKVKNTGEITGYAKNIVDYLPSGLTFSSELNSDWYLSGNYLHTKGLENTEIAPGEEKEIKLVLTKTMTNENTGLVNNRAEIYEHYNKYGEADIDSTPNNQVQGEDDFSSVDVIIGIGTGGSTIANIILLIINLVLIGIVIKIMIKNQIIKIPAKKGGRIHE